MCFRPPEATKRVICPDCGAINHPAARNCKKCKADLTSVKNMVPCPECGVPQPADSKVCGNCGFNGKPGSGDPAKRK